MAPPLGIAVIGSGQQALQACRAIRATPALRLLALCSGDPERGRRAAAQAGADLVQGLDALWKLDGLDAVFIATESHRHAEAGIAAASAGKHVLVEKPIDASPARAEALVAACRARNVVLSVVAQKRFTPRFARVKAVLDSGALGRPVCASVSVLMHRPDAYFGEGSGWRGDAARGGGVLLNQGVHYADLLCWWLGEPREAWGVEGLRREGLGAADTAGVAVRFAGGAVATLLLSTRVSPAVPERFEIACEKGTLQLEGGRVRVWDVPGQRPRGLLGPLTRRLPWPLCTALTMEALAPPRDASLADQLAHFAEAVSGGREPLSTGEDGLRALRLCQTSLMWANPTSAAGIFTR